MESTTKPGGDALHNLDMAPEPRVWVTPDFADFDLANAEASNGNVAVDNASQA